MELSSLAIGAAVVACTVAAVVASLCPPAAAVHPVSESAVLVTGGRGGIGRHAAEHLRRAGFAVIVTVRKEADTKSMREQGLLEPVVMDVTNPAHEDSAVRDVQALLHARGLRLAAVVANAGINPEGDALISHWEAGTEAPNELAAPEVAASVLETNVVGVARTARAFLPLLRRDSGRLVLVGSYFGTIGGALRLPHVYYEASKHALEGLADGLRRSLRTDGVAVSLVKPGNIQTAMNSKAGEDPPDVVADDIQHAIASPRPRARYYPGRVKGWPTGVLCRLFAHLPEALSDRLL